MKKPLLLAVAAAALGVAHAQSSVTVFGVIDQTLAHGSGSISHVNQMMFGGLSSNRIGFRGVEDLGGGLKASFWLEAGYNSPNGSGQSTNINNQSTGNVGGGGLTFNRRSTVSLAGSWGEVRAGRDFVPQYWNLFYGDPFGSVGVGAAINYTAIITGVVSTRASNQVTYLSPSLSGFNVHASHYSGQMPSNVANSDDGSGNGIRVWYERGPLLAGVAWSRTSYATGDVEQKNVNAAWNFGFAKVMATYGRDSAGAVSAKGASLGVTAPVGAGEVKASYSFYKKTDAAGQPEAKKFAIGYVHHLSKRTAVYATAARVNNNGGSALALNGSSTAPNESSTGLDLGFRHSF